ncbi:MAG TPA: hypothetical protein VMA55_20300 [Acidovorax sp.]|nr:hypothetical protein [Acidovorax sp.]
MDWLKTIAPALGTALLGPLGGAAAAFLADKLGIEEKTVEAVSEVLNSGRMTPEQIASVKLAEIEFQKFLKDHDIKLEQVHAEDRADARKMAALTRSPIPAVLSLLVTLGYFGVLVGMMTDVLNVKDSQALLIMLGSLGTAWGMVMAFWFGTTRSSSEKNEIIARNQPAR